MSDSAGKCPAYIGSPSDPVRQPCPNKALLGKRYCFAHRHLERCEP